MIGIARRTLDFIWLPFLLLFMLFGHSGSAVAQLTEKQGDAIIDELRQIRQALEKIQKVRPQPQVRPAPPKARAKVSTKDRPALGSDDAPVTIVEFTDYQCPFCRRFFETTLPSLKKEFIDTGKVRLVVKDLPLPMHSEAKPAATAVRCSGEQGKFWAMHDVLFTNNRHLKNENLKKYARDLGLDAERFNECLASHRYDEVISADMAEANKQSITGTPTFVIGRTSDGVIDGTTLRGAQPIDSFRTQINALLANHRETQVER